MYLEVDKPHRGAWRKLFPGRFLRISLLQIAINFIFSWGYWGLQTWLPTLLQQRGLSLPQSYGFIAISALCMIPGYITASYLTGKIGRKWTVVVYIGSAAIAGYAFASAESLNTVYASNFAFGLLQPWRLGRVEYVDRGNLSNQLAHAGLWLGHLLAAAGK